MTEDKIRQMIFDYISENISLSIDQKCGSYGSGDYFVVKIELNDPNGVTHTVASEYLTIST